MCVVDVGEKVIVEIGVAIEEDRGVRPDEMEVEKGFRLNVDADVGTAGGLRAEDSRDDSPSLSSTGKARVAGRRERRWRLKRILGIESEEQICQERVTQQSKEKGDCASTYATVDSLKRRRFCISIFQTDSQSFSQSVMKVSSGPVETCRMPRYMQLGHSLQRCALTALERRSPPPLHDRHAVDRGL